MQLKATFPRFAGSFLFLYLIKPADSQEFNGVQDGR